MTDKTRQDIERRFAPPAKGIQETRGVGGILANVWRNIARDLNITPAKYDVLVTEFIVDARRKAANQENAKTLSKGNLKRELERPSMTFKVFMRALTMLKVLRVRITFELEHANGRKTVHSQLVNLAAKSEAREALYEPGRHEIEAERQANNDEENSIQR